MKANGLQIYCRREQNNSSKPEKAKTSTATKDVSNQKKQKNTRNLTVYYNSGYCFGKTYSPTPKIILQGRWLENLGFSIGSKMVVTCEEGRLVIEKASSLAEIREDTISMVAEKDNPYGKE